MDMQGDTPLARKNYGPSQSNLYARKCWSFMDKWNRRPYTK